MGRCFFGLSDYEEENNWKWITGEPVAYTNWAVGEPNNENNDEDFAMYSHPIYPDGTWNDGNYSSEACRFICEWDGNIIASGTVDESYGNINWVINADGKLTVTGTEEFADSGLFIYGYDRTPWCACWNQITSAVVNTS